MKNFSKMPCRLAVALILFFIFLAYANSLYNGFVYDDHAYVEENHHIRSLKYFFSYFTDLRTYQGTGHEGQFNVYRPLVTFSFAVDYMINGLNPFIYHLTNLLLHLSVTLLLFFFFCRFTLRYSIAFITALLFTVHPAQIEAVSWISGRGNMLYGMFIVLSLIQFLFFLKKPHWKHGCIISLLYILGLFSKEMALSLLPLLILTYVFCKDRALLMPFIKLMIVLSVLSLGYILIRLQVTGALSQGGYWGGTLKVTFLTMVTVLIRYARLMFFPFRLNVLPDIPLIYSLLNPNFIFSLIAVSAVCIFLMSTRRRNNSVFSVWWVYASLLPVLNIIPIQALYAERFLYIGTAGGMLFLASVFNLINKRMRIMGYLAIICLFCIATVVRNADWKNNIALWESVIRCDPQNARAYNGLGMEALNAGDHKTAHENFKLSHQLDPRNYYTTLNLALTFKMQGDDETFLKMLDNALNTSEGYRPYALHNIGLFLLEKREYTSALNYLKEAVSLDENYANAFNSLGLCYAFLNQEDNAVNAWLTSSSLKGGWKEPLYNIVIFYLQHQNIEKALYYIDYAKKIVQDISIFTELEQSIK